jgi:hypothetical protein
MINWKGCGRKGSWRNRITISTFGLEGLSKTSSEVLIEKEPETDLQKVD